MSASDRRGSARRSATHSRSPRAARQTRRGAGATASCAPSSATGRCSRRSGATARSSLRGPNDEAVDQLRWMLAVDADHSEFLRRFKHDKLLADRSHTSRESACSRVATVAQALLRALCGQLIDSGGARDGERRIIRKLSASRRRPRTHRPTARRLHAPSPRSYGRSACTRGAARRSSHCAAQSSSSGSRAPLGGGRGTAGARARPRPVVGRRRLPRGTRPLRARARRRPRARAARDRAQGPLGRGRGDRRAARALRRVGRARERVPDGRLRREGCPAARGGVAPAALSRPRRLRDAARDPRRRQDRRGAARQACSAPAGPDVVATARREERATSCTSATASRRRCRIPRRSRAPTSSWSP